MRIVALKVLLALSVILCSSSFATSGQVMFQKGTLVTGGQTSVPWGWEDFCDRYAPECKVPKTEAYAVVMTLQVWDDMMNVNKSINHEIESVTDQDHWGVPEQWDYPADGRGDCEDYALLKRKIFLDAGWARSALLLTIIRHVEKNDKGELVEEGHLVLMVITTKGKFILDNLQDEVKSWQEFPYQWIKQQSAEDPNVWVSLSVQPETVSSVSKR